MSGITLQDNVYNRSLRQDQPKFKIWRSAGLILTYYCPIRCACCYVFGGPEAGSEQTEMSVDLALQCWRSLLRLSPGLAKVHLSGGEPFADYDRLKEILQAGREERLSGLEKIETSAYWCTEPAIVQRRLTELRRLGLTKLQISTDVYHQQWVPIERVRLAVCLAAEILGPTSVQVRWRDFMADPVLVGPMSPSDRAAAFAHQLAERPERMLGRAAEELFSLLSSSDYADLAELNCAGNLLGARHVHIDGAGNVFLGTCIGIIAARLTSSHSGGLDKLWCEWDWRSHPVLSVLIQSGPGGLATEAARYGYRPLPAYAGKCHLCYDVRRFLYRSGRFQRCLGPAVCYGLAQPQCTTDERSISGP